MLLYLLYKGHSQPIPEEAIQSILNLFKSQNQLSSLKHICGQKMTFVAEYCQFIACLPYIEIENAFYLLYKVGNCLSTPEEAIKPLLS